MAQQLLVTLDGIRVEVTGVPVECFIEELSFDEALQGCARAFTRAIEQLDEPTDWPEQPIRWNWHPTGLRLQPSASGHLFAQWASDLPRQYETIDGSSAAEQIDRFLNSCVPESELDVNSVSEIIRDISSTLPKGVFLWLGDDQNPRKVRVDPEKVQIGPESDPDADLELRSSFLANMQASQHAVIGGEATLSIEEVVKKQGLTL